jgi:hypothetical protein
MLDSDDLMRTPRARRLFRIDPGFGKPFSYLLATDLNDAVTTATLIYPGTQEVKELVGADCWDGGLCLTAVPS